MRLVDPLVLELEQEAGSTRQLLAIVPGHDLGWKPHAKSRPLGTLALHVAMTPGLVATMLSRSEMEVPSSFVGPAPRSADELLPALEESVATAKRWLSDMDDRHAMDTWTMMKQGKAVFGGPRLVIARRLLFNHWYHHRGQLTVYLRMLGAALPSIYGPTADVNPFA